ncbi:hypothetical protein [Hymenobacter terricola]|uniref:hypothetical protein n=1 Tax=Hymenobacter terricola TaxID=2819236 RepID=UPI001B3014CF|nr:hypothetical protein [Hymenobacter terricola]
MNITDIKTEFGAYYINGGQNVSRIVKMLLANSTTDSVCTPFLTDETVYRAAQARMQRVLQPFQKAWTPIGEIQLVPVAIEQFKQKIDTQEYPDDLEGTWLGFLAGDGIDRKTWPFVRWFIETQLLPQAKQDYELNEVYKGVYTVPAVGTAGAPSTAMNGIRKAINDQVTAGRITPIATGALSTDPKTFVEQVEAFVDKFNEKYWSVNMQLCLSQALERRFHRGIEAKYGRNTDYKSNPGTVNFTNVDLIGLPSMIGSDKLWCTPKENLYKLGKKTANMNAVQLESVDRLIKMFSDWWSGVGFLIPEVVFTNDRDLV